MALVQIVISRGGSTFSGINTLRPRQNGRHFADDIFKCIFINENAWIALKISLKFIPKVRINNIPSLVQIMAWRRPGDKPLSEPMMVSLLTHICVTRPQWVNYDLIDIYQSFPVVKESLLSIIWTPQPASHNASASFVGFKNAPGVYNSNVTVKKQVEKTGGSLRHISCKVISQMVGWNDMMLKGMSEVQTLVCLFKMLHIKMS